MGVSWSWWHALNRRKVLDSLALGNSELARVLTTFDLTALGVGSTLGVGVYVLAGNVSKNIAGPAVVVSFLIAAIASVFAGLCYAEFGARVPRAGSAYVYSYVCMGELTAFIIGWNLILEYVIGSASVAKGLSKYLDSLLNETMEKTFLETMPVSSSSVALSPYFDVFAFAISFILAVALALGVKESSTVNNLFTIVNVGVVLFVIIAGSFKADSRNWKIKKEDIHIDNPEDAGEGGFFPFGVSGAIKGAATCFYGFIGFDCVATTGEEVKNPQKAIPIAIIVSLTIIFLSYFGVSTVLTLMWPYYLQDPDAPLPKVFIEIGWPVAQWIVTIGGIFGLCASLFGAMFPLPRIIYAMAMDGLIFRFLGQVHHYFRTPLYGTLIAGLLTGIMAGIFDLDQLVNMMSIGTLLAYTIVSSSVLLLRYTELDLYGGSDIVSPEYIESTNLVTLKEPVSFGTVSKQLFNSPRKKQPTFLSSSVVTAEVLAFFVLSTLLCLCFIFWERDLVNLSAWALSVTSVIAGFLVLILLSVSLQPTSSKPLSFKVPFVPVVPAASILINIYLMLKLDGDTWIRFGVWMAIGFAIHFFCHMRRSEATYVNIVGRKHQPANSELNEDPQSLNVDKGKDELSESQTTNTTVYKHPEQGIVTEMYRPVTISGTNIAVLLQHDDSVLNPNLDSKMISDDLQSLTYVNNLESTMDCSAGVFYNRETTAADGNVGYVMELESKNSVITHTAALSSTVKCSVVGEATLSTVLHLSASVVSPPADVSLSPECVQTTGINDVIRSPSDRSARDSYPNVVIIPYDSNDEISEHNRQEVPGHGEYGVDHENEEPGTISSQIFDKREPFSKNQEYLDGLKQIANIEGSEMNPELRRQSMSTQPFLPPLPPPLPPPLQPPLPPPLPLQPPLPPPLPPPPPLFTPSPVTAPSSSSIFSKTASYHGNDFNRFLIRSSNIKSETEPTMPVTPDPQFLLSTRSLKTSDLANKLEAMLQKKINNLKYDTVDKEPQLVIKNSTHNKNSDNTGDIKHHQMVVTTNANERAENWTESVEESKVIQSEADEEFVDRETELAKIKEKLEQFLANRADISALTIPPSHPKLAIVEAKNSEIRHENDDAQSEFKQLSKTLLLNETETFKSKDVNNNFDVVRKHRLLMGEVLTSLKFVVSRNRADSEVGSISDDSADADEVFED